LYFFDELCELCDIDGQTIIAACAQAGEEADEPEDVMDEDHSFSPMNAGASQSIYQNSPIRNENGTPVSNL